MKNFYLTNIILVVSIFFCNVSLAYVLNPLFLVMQEDNTEIYTLKRCNAWHAFIADLAKQSNDNKTYKNYFRKSIFLYDLSVKALMQLGIKEKEAEKKIQEDLIIMMENYRLDANKNKREFGHWYGGYFKGKLGDADICDEYYDKIKDIN